MLLALGLLMGVNAWSFDNASATFTWTVGNESVATVTSDAADGVKETKVAVGVGLTTGTKSDYAANNGHTMVTYLPAENKPGAVETVMIEYRVKMKKGVIFTLTGISYDALKEGTNDAAYKWSYAVDGVESTIADVVKDSILRNDNSNSSTAQLNHTHAVTATAGQEVGFRIYVSGFANTKKFALSNIVLTGTINGEEEVRTFTDFKVDFRERPYAVVLPTNGELPTNVTIADTVFNDAQHGIKAGTITVNVDGPVKFTIGGCQYGNHTINVKKDGVALTSIDNNAGCDNGFGTYTKFVTWTYNVEEAAELSFTVNGYLPYFFAEACDFVPKVEVRYYDVDGKTLIGSETVDGGSQLVFAYGSTDVTVADGKAFRGWFNATVPTATKVKGGITLTEDLNLYAKATDIEVAELGKIFDYDFRPSYFYPEDHELLTFTGSCSYNGTQHGWAFGNGSTLSIQVAGNALLAVDVCTYSPTGAVTLKDANNDSIGVLTVEREVTADGAKQSIYYEGPATTLTFSFSATNYIHHIKVYNIAALPTKDEQLGYYIIAPGDGAGLKLVLEALQDNDKIFLPNGVYDFGEDALTQIAKNNISIIGQSMEGTIIRNAPDVHNEGIGTTATLLITGNNTYLQDLTLENNLDYFTALVVMSNGRGVCLQDKGSQTICKNVRLLSNQDTYYSNKVGALKYFEDCEIHGTVDFICGDGSVYFKNNKLVCEQRNVSGGGADAVTASNADTNDKGYVFESCSIRYADGIIGNLPVVSLGRAWNNKPKTVFLNTVLADNLVMTKDASAQKDKIARWTLGAMNALPELFGEYNSVNAAGQFVSPNSNKVTFVLGSSEKQMETILTAEQAATYTMAYTLGDWATTAENDAKQVELKYQNGQLMNEGVFTFLVEENGSATLTKEWPGIAEGRVIRAANNRGGFGAPAVEDSAQDIENTTCKTNVEKIIRNGQVIIIRDNQKYNVLGGLVE